MIRGLVTLVVVMSVLIVAGLATLAITIVRRLSIAEPSAPVLLDEPPGTRMASMAQAGDRLAVLLIGGGPDRVLLFDAHAGKVVGRIELAR